MNKNQPSTEKITIDGLGGLANAAFPLAKVTVLIGPQASGKSLAAKLIYFCKSYPREVFAGVIDELSKDHFEARLRQRFMDYFSSALSEKPFEVSYTLDQDSISIKAARQRKGSGANRVEINGSDFFDREYTTLRRVYGKQSKKINDAESADGFDLTWRIQQSYQQRVRNRFGNQWSIQQVFLPAGRSYFSFLQGSIFSLISNNIPLDPFIKEFGSNYERYKNHFLRAPAEREKGILDQIEGILKGKFIRHNSQDCLLSTDGRTVPVSNSSSGQQEALPLAIMLQYFDRVRGALFGRSVYIEEPEAHLFPDTQKQLMELLIYVLGMPSKNAQLLVTTHSPYVCAALNNLILAGDIASKSPITARRSLKKITSLGAYVDFDDLSVLALDSGSAKSILDKKSRLIDTSYLDAISEDLISQREQLLNLQD